MIRLLRAHPRVTAIAVAMAVAVAVLLPGVGALRRAPVSLVVEDRAGSLIGARVASDGQWRFPFQRDIPSRFTEAIVQQEDRRFRLHPGVDPIALVRAAIQNIRTRKVASGGSTISMQVIRLSRMGKPRTFAEKIVESILAVKLELFTRKSTILALYAAHAPFGGNVVGLEAASWRYFNRPPSMLSWAESATLAVLPNEPRLVHPGRNRSRLIDKRNRLLHRLMVCGRIDSLEYRLALSEPLVSRVHPLPRFAPHLLDRLGAGAQGGRVRTNIDASLQDRVNTIIERHAGALRANGIHNAAALVVEVDSAAVLAYVGNVTGVGDSLAGHQVDCIVAPRSTGSVLKPFLYATMLDCGELLPSMLVPDIPTSIGGFSPQNFDLEYEGAVPARAALARSLNVPAVRMLIRHGVSRFHRTLCNLGMTTVTREPSDYGISLILGGAEGTLWELTGIYASMARCVNYFFSSEAGDGSSSSLSMPVIACGGRPAQRPLPLSAGACWRAMDAMKELVRPGDDVGWKEFASSRRVAWKTGTSFGFRDGWAIGVTPRYAIGVWVGNASGEGRPGLIGIAAAAPILFEIFSALPATSWFDTPEADLRRVAVCRQSGYLPGADCNELDTVWTPTASQRAPACPYHRRVHLESTGTWQVTSACARVDAMQHRSWFVLPPVMESYYRRRHAEYQPLPPMQPGCASAEKDNPIGLVYPHAGTVVYVPREMSGDVGRVVFEAAHRSPGTTIFWHLDNEYIGSTSGIHQVAVNPVPGKHTLTLVDSEGNRIERTIDVLHKE